MRIYLAPPAAMKNPLLLAIDQGTTSSRAIVFDRAGAPVAVSQHGFGQHYPADGWVEHDPEEIWRTTLAACREVMAQTEAAGDGEIAAIGIANQRETTVLWERGSGKPVYNAIVWQDRRTAARCEELLRGGGEGRGEDGIGRGAGDEGEGGSGTGAGGKDRSGNRNGGGRGNGNGAGDRSGNGGGGGNRARIERAVSEKTGLLLDAYFSATKIAWILDHVPGARRKAEAGELAFGTIDTFLIWRLTEGARHLTDATNASRTLLFDIHRQRWDEELLATFDVPAAVLPQVLDCADDFGASAKTVLGREIPICGVAGDQQAALFGQACFQPGMVKSTYGTGCFIVMNTGDRPVASKNRLLSTVGYRLDGNPVYALEGSIFNAGTAIQWLRDGIGLIDSTAEIDALIASTKDNQGVYMVPAFTGLGAPHWDSRARAAILGITRDTAKAQLVRAALEAVCYQTGDLLAAMEKDSGAEISLLRVDGGMAVNDWLLQFLADITGVAVERPVVTETTATGAAYLAGLRCGLFDSPVQISRQWRKDRAFQPQLSAKSRDALVAGWKDALGRVKSRAG